METNSGNVLERCDAIIKYVAANSTKKDDYFEVFIVLDENVSDTERAEIKDLVSSRSNGPRVIVAMLQMDMVYRINELSFIHSISAPTHPDFERIIRALTAQKKISEVKVSVEEKGLFHRFCDFLRSK
ncbi:MAG: hypothetical protein HY225_03250 [Candidatus Vogelbacteria bacterium]|nr:hypothetical protein [Candidatus Vogelbacteria bacterium]